VNDQALKVYVFPWAIGIGLVVSQPGQPACVPGLLALRARACVPVLDFSVLHSAVGSTPLALTYQSVSLVRGSISKEALLMRF